MVFVAAYIVELCAVNLLYKYALVPRLCEYAYNSAVFFSFCNKDFVNRSAAADCLADGVAACYNNRLYFCIVVFAILIKLSSL